MTLTVPTATDHSSAFPFATQTPIRNTPTYEDCIRVYSEVKANAAAVPSTLGGTFHGHLGLVLSTEEYAVMVPNTPYIRAPDPGELGNIIGTVEARSNLKNAWQTQKIAFLDADLLERQLMSHIIKSFDRQHLSSIIEPQSGLPLFRTIPLMFQQLFSLFGLITTHELNERRNTIQALTLSGSQQVTSIFHKIDEYSQVARHSGIPESADQLINLGLSIISRSGIFNQDLRTWHDKPAIEKTWPSFCAHFQNAQTAIRRSAPAASTLGFHQQANAVARELLPMIQQNLPQHDPAAEAAWNEQVDLMANTATTNATMMTNINNILTEFTNQQEQSNAALLAAAAQRPAGPPTIPHTMHQQNHLPPAFQQPPFYQQPPFQFRPYQQPQQYQQIPYQQQQQQQFPTYQGRGGGRNRGGGRGGQRGGRTNQGHNGHLQQGTGYQQQQYGNYQQTNEYQQQQRQRSPPAYCWSHGNCAHTSNMCQRPAPGHQNAATFQNMMNGNPRRCNQPNF